MMQTHTRRAVRLMMATATVALVAACQDFDFDLRDLGNGFDTTGAISDLPDRPAADNRGIISYPTYQVVVAQRDDTARTIAARLGLDGDQLAAYNGIDPDTALRQDELLALPTRVAEPSPATGAATTGPITPTQVDVTELAGAAIDRAGPTTTTTTPLETPAQTTTQTIGVEPIQHQVLRGETLFSIARLYGVAPRALAEWNGLGADLSVREGQFLFIPNGGPAPAITPAAVEQPGEGSVTPVPPSAADPLPPVDDIATPEETPAVEEVAVPDLGETQTIEPSEAQMVMPTSGSIIRAYAPGRNEGIDIGASAGAPVVAADAGVVAAVTTDTAGIQILVIRHSGGLLTVYTHLENLTVARGDTVARGQPIGSVRPGDPSFLHFEVRRGTESEDPTDFLP